MAMTILQVHAKTIINILITIVILSDAHNTYTQHHKHWSNDTLNHHTRLQNHRQSNTNIANHNIIMERTIEIQWLVGIGVAINL